MGLLRKQTVFAGVAGSLANGLCYFIHAWPMKPGAAVKSGGLWIARWPECHRP
jgi:hypothetical protein